MHRPSTGIWLFPDAPARELVDAVVAADEAGIDEVWIADEGVMREPLAVLSAAATMTTRIRLGIGITTPALRHPGALGASIATLDELSNGRAMLGLGIGGDLTLAPFGVRVERPVAMLRDAIRIARAVVERRPTAGYETPAHAMPARKVPIYVASRGEQINRLASRDADGVFLSGLRLDDVAEKVAWARSVRPITVALYASAQFAPHAPDDPTTLRGTPDDVAAGLQQLVTDHAPDTIGLALVDRGSLGASMANAIAALAPWRTPNTQDTHGTPDAWINTKTLRAVDPPLAIEQLVFEVRTEVFATWQEVEFEMWTLALADRFPALLHKETWVQDLGDWKRVSIVIHWRTLEEWLGIDPVWLEAQEAAFSQRIGPDNVRLVGWGHETGAHYRKISDYD